ncbi:MAG: hypothetical protein L0H94_06235 [Nitrospira sp.]|nr:hypothetical protein [Nitrospira sp.]
MKSKQLNKPKIRKRYGVGELFGLAVAALTPEELRKYSASGFKAACPHKASGGNCHKKGGVCSLIPLEEHDGEVRVVGLPIATCPTRFLEKDRVMEWVGETILGMPNPQVVSEVSFLMGKEHQESEPEDEVGRIDKVLVNLSDSEMKWCALEMQAVYFSGMKMEHDFALMREWEGPGIPFPTKVRRPDFRSSGPKRLMPQLQIKVPTLRRWCKKMAVVVDKAFAESLWPMRKAGHISNADIVWFVVTYGEVDDGVYQLRKHEILMTTLEDAVEGLTGGVPVTLDEFESSIHDKLSRQ